VKRHHIAMLGGSGCVQMNSIDYSYSDVVVFDVQTGENLVIRATGSMFGDTCTTFQDPKARIMTDPVTHENIQLYAITKPVNTTVDYVYTVIDKNNPSKTLQALIDN
jgi:hypothetical protein